MNIKASVLGIFIFIISVSVSVAQELPSSFTAPTSDIVFNVKEIVISSDYTPEEGGSVDSIMTPSPADKIKQRLSDIFFATTKGADVLNFTITDASIKEEHTKSDSWFKRGQFKYTANFALNMQLVDSKGKVIASAICKSWGVRTISDNSSIEEREKSLSDMTDKLIDSLIVQVREETEKGFAPYLKAK